MSNRRPYQRATSRFLKAYFTAVVIVLSYGWLSFRARLFGEEYRENRLDAVHAKNARRIEKTILALQGLFIKVGQLFSIMTNFLPETFRTGLENLQDSVPARPFEQIRMQIVQELGQEPDRVFATFEVEPIASASLGQVHLATTHDGRKVAVKVRHFGVEEMSRADLRTIWRILRLVKNFVKVRGLDNYYHEIRAMIIEEMDFQKESENLQRIAENFKDRTDVVFPKVVPEYSSKRVLTLEFQSGTKITDVQALTALGLDPAIIARNLLTVYCQMIFVDGIYHADPHPGNILVRDDGTIVLLDFGAVGHLSLAMRNGIGSFLEAILKGDEEQLLQSLKAMGFLRIGSDQSDAAARVIEHFHQKFQEEIRMTDFSLSSVQIDASRGFAHLSDLKDMNIGIRQLSTAFQMPREWVLLERTTLLLAGICTHLDPAMKPTQIIRPYLEEFVLGKDRDWSEMLFDLSREKVMSFLSLPRLFEKFVNRSISGKMTVRVDGLYPATRLVYLAVQQLTFAILAGASAASGLYFHHAGEFTHARWSGYAAAGFVALIAIAMFRARRNRF